MEKNIVFLLHLPPPVHGSSVIGKYIKESRIINTNINCRYINLLISRKVDETGKFSFLKMARFIFVLTELFIKIIQKKPDICYLALTATGSAFYKDVILIATLKLLKIKRIYHLHNKGVKNHESGLNALLYRFIFKNSHVIILSQNLYSDINKFVLPHQISICPNGIEKFEIETTSSNSVKNCHVRLLFLSNLIESKGVFLLLDACKILMQRNIVFECEYVGGEGDISVELFNSRVTSLGLSQIVIYSGKRYGLLKQESYLNADIFVFPTYYHNETFGLVNLEAMQHSLPVISTYEGAIPDIVEDGVTGYLVPQRDSKALADKLEILIKNKELREKMGKAGRKKFEQFYTLDKFENRLLEILENQLYNKQSLSSSIYSDNNVLK